MVGSFCQIFLVVIMRAPFPRMTTDSRPAAIFADTFDASINVVCVGPLYSVLVFISTASCLFIQVVTQSDVESSFAASTTELHIHVGQPVSRLASFEGVLCFERKPLNLV